jgi:hypothetical protein
MSVRTGSLFALGFVACLGIGCDNQTEPSALTDPCTGSPVGHLDEVSDKLVFNDGFEVSRGDIVRLDGKAAPEIRCAALEMGPDERSAQATWANGSCWVMVEDYAGESASCSGCCHAHYCWESCSDYSHS